MGAEFFITKAAGATPREAFERAREKALYDHGHAGYTGTIAEKEEVIEVPLPGNQPLDHGMGRMVAERFRTDTTSPLNDKWGPAGAIELIPDPECEGPRQYLLFGWAAS